MYGWMDMRTLRLASLGRLRGVYLKIWRMANNWTERLTGNSLLASNTSFYSY